MKAEVNIKLKLKDNKQINLNYDDGLKLFDELKKIYEKEKAYIPQPYYPNPYPYWYINQPSYTGTEIAISGGGSPAGSNGGSTTDILLIGSSIANN